MSEIHIPSPQTHLIASLQPQRPEIIPMILNAASETVEGEVPPQDFYIASKMYWRNNNIDQTGELTGVVNGMLGNIFFQQRNASGLEIYPIITIGKTQSDRDFQVTSFAVHGLRTYDVYEQNGDVMKRIETGPFTDKEAEAHIGAVVTRVNTELELLSSPYRLPEYQ